MRALVRTLGLLLIGIGGFLWLRAAWVASHHPVVPAAVVPAVKTPAPSSKIHHHSESAESKVPSPRLPKLESQSGPLSKVVLVEGQGRITDLRLIYTKKMAGLIPKSL